MITTTEKHSESSCRDALRGAGLFARADIIESWPMSAGEVLALLDSADYIIDPAALDDLARRGFVKLPPHGRWSAAAICELAGVLEGLRLWKPFSEIHAAKKTEPKKLLEQIRQDGEVEQAVGMFPREACPSNFSCWSKVTAGQCGSNFFATSNCNWKTIAGFTSRE